MDRRELLKKLAAATLVGQMNPIPFLHLDEIPRMEKHTEISIPPMWLRTFFLRKERNFDHMADRYIIGMRCAKFNQFARSSVPYQKYIVGIQLPEDTPTPGLDALHILLQGIQDAS